MTIHSIIHVKLKDGSCKAIKTEDVEQIFLDKESGDIIVWWKEEGETVSAPMSYWERGIK